MLQAEVWRWLRARWRSVEGERIQVEPNSNKHFTRSAFLLFASSARDPPPTPCRGPCALQSQRHVRGRHSLLSRRAYRRGRGPLGRHARNVPQLAPSLWPARRRRFCHREMAAADLRRVGVRVGGANGSRRPAAAAWLDVPDGRRGGVVCAHRGLCDVRGVCASALRSRRSAVKQSGASQDQEPRGGPHPPASFH